MLSTRPLLVEVLWKFPTLSESICDLSFKSFVYSIPCIVNLKIYCSNNGVRVTAADAGVLRFRHRPADVVRPRALGRRARRREKIRTARSPNGRSGISACGTRRVVRRLVELIDKIVRGARIEHAPRSARSVVAQAQGDARRGVLYTRDGDRARSVQVVAEVGADGVVIAEDHADGRDSAVCIDRGLRRQRRRTDAGTCLLHEYNAGQTAGDFQNIRQQPTRHERKCALKAGSRLSD